MQCSHHDRCLSIWKGELVYRCTVLPDGPHRVILKWARVCTRAFSAESLIAARDSWPYPHATLQMHHPLHDLQASLRTSQGLPDPNPSPWSSETSFLLNQPLPHRRCSRGLTPPPAYLCSSGVHGIGTFQRSLSH